MVLLDTNVFVIDRFFRRDDRYITPIEFMAARQGSQRLDSDA